MRCNAYHRHVQLIVNQRQRKWEIPARACPSRRGAQCKT